MTASLTRTKRRRIGFTIPAAAAIWLLTGTTLFGQSFGASVGGVVTDETGAVLPGVTVTITHVANGRTIVMTTEDQGGYRAVALQPGDYRFDVERSGFMPETRLVTLLVGANPVLDFTMRIAGVESRTTVRAAIPLVEVGRSQPSSAITKAEIDALPVFGRNFMVLAQLLPGSAPIATTVGRFAVTKFGGPADQRSGYTTLIDGGDIDDAQWGSPTINVGQDAVQEFKVFRNQFDAQYGHALNAVVSVATRSGTNQPSGTAFYFGRDRALNARNFFASSKPPFSEYRLGGSFGGPLVRDRTHVFGTYERDRVDTVRIIALPPSNPFARENNGTFPARTENQTGILRLDHRIRPTHGLALRYGFDRQESLRAGEGVSSDTSQVDIRNRSHSLVFEDTWTPRQSMANAFRIHVLDHTLGTTPRSTDAGIRRPSGTIGQTNSDSQVLPQTKATLFDVLYRHTARHDFKFGGEASIGIQDNDSHVLEYGLWEFQTDAPFDPNNRSTWPIAFSQQKATVVTYRSREAAAFAQDDWRLNRRVTLNLGLRYDVDFNLRLNGFYGQLLADPIWAGLDRFVRGDRGSDTNNLQPRIGATWDARGDGRLVVRGGWGMYVTRNRPWYQLRSMNQFTSSVIRITDATRMGFFPDVTAVLGGRTLDQVFASTASRQIGTLIPDDFVHPYALNTTAGVGWQINDVTALDVDYVHSYANHQVGMTDRNLPPTGPANPRPVQQFGQVLTLENYSRSWYDALESQFRTQLGSRGTVHASYTLSRSYLDGVDFFLTTRGTQRTPHERGYNPSDQRHNLTIAGTLTLPWSTELSGVARLISGSPIKVQSGVDLDGDTIITGDLPPGIPITVGRERVQESQTAIDALRASRNLPPISDSLLKLDPYRSIDLRVTKAVHTGNTQRVEIFIEGFNVTNHVNFRPPLGNPPNAGASIIAPAFLVRTAARDARQMQWGLRYVF
jgi:Carboxypeptidase regulatory-like domain/TonB dependent receptor-like, beta-barrel